MEGGEGVISTIMPRAWHMKEHKGMGGTEGGIPCCKGNGHCVAQSTNIKKKKSIIQTKIFTPTVKNL